MKLQYSITEELYTDLLTFQIRQRYRSLSGRAVYVSSNLLMLSMAVYFLAVRTAYGWPLRIAPLLIAGVYAVFSTVRRRRPELRARRTLRNLLQGGVVSGSFLGPHRMRVENGEMRVTYRDTELRTPLCEITDLKEIGAAAVIMVGEKVFEMLPESVLSADGAKERLLEAIREAKRSAAAEGLAALEKEFGDEALYALHWRNDYAQYIRGQVEGHRAYYTTKRPWIRGQLIRVVILGYGAAMLASRTSVPIGVGFLLIGIMLNRQLLTALSPLAFYLTRAQAERVISAGMATDEAAAFLSAEELALWQLGQTLRTKRSGILAVRSRGAYCCVFTDADQMLVLPRKAFSSDAACERFLQTLRTKP